MDEAGRGSLAGPLLAAGVLIDLERIGRSERRALAHLDDSKQKSPEEREALYPHVIRAAASCSVAVRAGGAIANRGRAVSNQAARSDSMRALAPQYWEERRSVRPASVWLTAPDAHYLVLRTDVEVEQQGTINPYITAYASYIDLVIGQSLGPDLPLWFRRGFTGVISNTIVRDDHILFGAPIPWKLEILRDRAMLTLPKLLSVTRQSREDKEADKRDVFDAESWAFVHFLMFGDEGARADKLNAYGKLVSTGTDAAKAFAESFGPVEALQGPFRVYFQRSIFSFRRINLDVSVERERFPIRPVPPAESASVRALFHAAMRRPVESRAAIAEARKADPRPPAATLPKGCWPIRTTRSTRRRQRTGKPRSSARRGRMRTTGSRS